MTFGIGRQGVFGSHTLGRDSDVTAPTLRAMCFANELYDEINNGDAQQEHDYEHTYETISY